ncbi:MAG: type II toxin-antitoxin system CcdA family antitoxin [Sulfuricella sp.]|nr:type II toxin-antitoxin system CcdA family antitoxin [Sulfuricella sp.]
MPIWRNSSAHPVRPLGSLKAQEMTNNLSGDAESLLADFVKHERPQYFAAAKTVEATIVTWNDFNAQLGSFADEHSTL